MTLPIASDPTPNPITIPGGLSDILLNKNLFSQLTRPDATADVTPSPDLAQKWEVSSDGKTYTFHLRQGVKWHDGTPFSADDVKFTLDEMMNPKVNAAFATDLGPYDSANVIDSQTMTINLKAPYGPLLVMLDYDIMIMPKHLLEGVDLNSPTKFVQHPIGTGAYKFKEFVSGDHYTLVANPDYWDGPPKIGTVVYKILAEVPTQIAQLRTGELDMAMLEPAQAESLANVSNVVVNTANQTNYYYLGLNNSNPLFADVRVRQALAYGLDRETILKSVFRDQGSLATGPISPPMGWAFPTDQQPWPYDPDKAMSLLGEAGWKKQGGKLMKDGKEFSFKILLDAGNTTRQSMALAAQQYYQNLGMVPTIDTEEFNKWYTLSSKSEYDMGMFWFITAPDPDSFYDSYVSTESGDTDKFKNAEVNTLFAQGRAATTPAERAPIYAKLQQLLYQQQPDVFILYPKEFRVFSKKLHGYTDIGFRDILYYTYRWTLDS